MKLSRFFESTPCACCGRRVPRNRTWRANVRTPSCWLTLTPAEQSRFVPESAPCLVCQDRLAERRRARTSSTAGGRSSHGSVSVDRRVA